MKILALDPGNVETAWVLWDGQRILDKGKDANDVVMNVVDPNLADRLAIEMIASYGMAVGRSVFETCVWIGRFMQIWNDTQFEGVISSPIRISRIDVKNHICHSSRATDSNIREALLDRVGPQGNKKAPGPTFGVSKDIWSALAVGVTVYDKIQNGATFNW